MVKTTFCHHLPTMWGFTARFFICCTFLFQFWDADHTILLKTSPWLIELAFIMGKWSFSVLFKDVLFFLIFVSCPIYPEQLHVWSPRSRFSDMSGGHKLVCMICNASSGSHYFGLGQNLLPGGKLVSDRLNRVLSLDLDEWSSPR